MTVTTDVKTLLLTDIEGSTALWERNPDVMGGAVARHEELVQSAVADAGGKVLKQKGEGDSTFSVFADPVAAVTAAVRLQEAMASEPWPTDQPLRVRAGVHTGVVEWRDGDYFGRAVNRAARVRAIAEGSTILLTSATASQAGGGLCDGAALVDLGEHPLRDLAGVTRLHAVSHPALPDPETALAHLLRRASSPVPAPLSLLSSRRMIGRDRWLATLAEAWDAAGDGRASLAIVGGEPGVGKTQLAAALAEHAARTGALVLYGRCEEEPLRPYQPLAEVIGHALDRLSKRQIAEVTAGVAPVLALIVPEHRALLAEDDSPTSERFVLFQAVSTFFGRVAALQPILTIVDDAHWADEPSLALLQHVLRAQPDASGLFLATYRHSDVDGNRGFKRFLVDVRRTVPVTEARLDGLSRAEVSELLGDDHAEHVDAIWSATDGNPFFVIALAEDLRHGGTAGIPASVRDSIAVRIERLPEDVQRFLRAAAVAGIETDSRIAALGADVEVAAASAALRSGMLTDEDARPGQVRFLHALVRSAVLDGLTSVERADLHRRVAHAIERIRPRQLDESASRLAHHYREAGEVDAGGAAFRWSMRAGYYAGRKLAYEQAESQYRAAAGIADRAGDHPGRTTAELLLGEVISRSGRPATGRAIGETAYASACAIGEAELAAWAMFSTAFGQPPGSPGMIDRLARSRRGLPPASRWRGPVDVLYASELMQVGSVDAGIDLLHETVRRGRDEGDGSTLLCAQIGIHTLVDKFAAPVADMLADATLGCDEDVTSLSLTPAVLRVQCESFRIGELVAAGDVPGAREAAAAFEARYGNETGVAEVNVPLFAITDSALAGDWAEWRRRLRRFTEDPELAGGYALHLLACEMLAAWLQGRLAEAVRVIESMPPSMVLVRPGLALAVAENDRASDARRLLSEIAADGGIERRAGTIYGRTELTFLGFTAAQVGDIAIAARIYDVLRPRTGQVAGWAGWAFWCSFDAVLGALAACCGQLDRAAGHFTAAQELHRRAGWRALSALTAADHATTLLRRGDPGDVDAALRMATDGLRVAHELGLRRAETRLSALVGDHRASAPG